GLHCSPPTSPRPLHCSATRRPSDLTPTVTLPGAAVWHADFYWKDGDDFGQFFGLRNSLITATVHGIEPREVVGALARRIGQEIVDRKSTRLNSSHVSSSYAVVCLRK